MRAGVLRHRILVEQPIRSQNATGEEEILWAVVGKVWGSVAPLSGREQLLANQIDATTNTRIIMRWSQVMNDLDPTWRLSHQGTVYNIFSITNVNMARQEIEIMATSGVNLG